MGTTGDYFQCYMNVIISLLLYFKTADRVLQTVADFSSNTDYAGLAAPICLQEPLLGFAINHWDILQRSNKVLDLKQ